MTLYFNDTNTGNHAWFDTLNWWEDAAGNTVPHGAIPAYNDDCYLATGVTETVTVDDTGGASGFGSVDLGGGSCNFPLTVNNSQLQGGVYYGDISLTGVATITGGTYQGAVTIQDSATTYGGSFLGSVTNNNYINGGGFYGNVTNNNVIQGGYFYGYCSNFNVITAGTFQHVCANYSSVSGGDFTQCTTFYNSGTVAGGTFGFFTNGGGTITGGNFSPVGTVAYSDLIVSGVCTYNPGTTAADPGFVTGGGTYTPTTNVTGIPVSPDILGVGFLL